MRLIRSVLRPANISLSHPLRWRQVLKTSNESLNSVIFRTDHGSNIQLRGRSFSASSASDSPQERKTGRRLPKHERKTMVESYVKKYREMKGGMFPTASEIQKVLGGSFYVIREILEAVKYDSKVSSSDKAFTTSVHKNAINTVERSSMDGKVSPSDEMRDAVNHAKPSINSEIKLSTQTAEDEGPNNDILKNDGVVLRKELEKKSLAEAEGSLNDQEVVDGPISKQETLVSISKSLVIKEGPQLSTSVAENDEDLLPVNDKSKDVRLPAHHLTGERGPHSDPETSIKVEIISEDKKNLDDRQQSTYSEMPQSELDKVPTEYTPEKKSTVWENLKSFASGIFGIWRR